MYLFVKENHQAFNYVQLLVGMFDYSMNKTNQIELSKIPVMHL